MADSGRVPAELAARTRARVLREMRQWPTCDVAGAKWLQ